MISKVQTYKNTSFYKCCIVCSNQSTIAIVAIYGLTQEALSVPSAT
jgi:hypothetical protein